MIAAFATGQLTVALGLWLVGWVAAVVRRVGPRVADVSRDDLAISVLVPLYGRDPGLEENLAAYNGLDVPEAFEVLLGVDDVRDGALPAASLMAETWPARFRVIVGRSAGHVNGKVASLDHLLPHARNGLLWTMDANTRPTNEHLRAQVAEWKAARPRPVLVHAPVVAVGGTGLGAALERVTHAAWNSVGAELARLAREDAVVGKSMLFHRDDLQQVGGFAAFGGARGEDYWLAHAFRRIGTVRYARVATRHALGHVTLGEYVRRQLRWSIDRRRIAPVASWLEPMTHVAGMAMVWGAIGLAPVQLVAVSLGCVFAGDAVLVWLHAGVLRPLDLLVWPLRQVLALVVWARTAFAREVVWRGRTLPA